MEVDVVTRMLAASALALGLVACGAAPVSVRAAEQAL
jgi:hypothetical protein